MIRLKAFLSLAAVGLFSVSAIAGTAIPKTFQSKALGQTVSYWLYRPANYDAEVAAGKKFSVIYLMHWWLYKSGGWHIQDQWRRNPKLDQCIDSVSGIICAAPQDETQFAGEKGTAWWMDSPTQPAWKYSSLIYQDMVGEIEATNEVIKNRGNRGLSGASMGGFGTLHNLRLHSDVFRLGYAIVPLTDLSKHIGGTKCEYGLCSPLGNGGYNAAFDPMQNVNDFKNKDIKFAFYTGHCAPTCQNPWPNTCNELNCAAGPDFFRDECVAFSNALKAAGVDHTFNDYANDGHEYPDPAKMVMILRFFEQNFGTVSVSEPRASHRDLAAGHGGRVRLGSQISRRDTGRDYIGIDGRNLRTPPATGIVVERGR